MSFDVNPSEWRPHVSTNRANAMDKEGRGASGGGAGFGTSAFGDKAPLGNEDEISFSSKTKDIDEKMEEGFFTLFKVLIDFIKKLLYKIFNVKFD